MAETTERVLPLLGYPVHAMQGIGGGAIRAAVSAGES